MTASPRSSAWAVAAVFGIHPADLNDDRLGRCRDALAAVHDRLRGDLTVQAMAACGLATTAVRWDLTSVLVSGAYPPEEQVAGYAQVRSGSGGGKQKQVRSLQVTTDDGAVPIWDQAWDGNTTDVATVIATMHALREYARCTECVLLGDSKLLSEANRQALLTAGVGYLAPLPRTAALDTAFLALPPEQLGALDYVSAREAGKPPDERTTYHGYARTVVVMVPDGAGGARPHELRRVCIRSSEERAACRRPPQADARQRERAAAEIGSA